MRCGILTISFVVLLIIKLTESADIPWLVVFAPLFVGLSIAFIVLMMIACVSLLALLSERGKEK